jgi:hypothetical protein
MDNEQEQIKHMTDEDWNACVKAVVSRLRGYSYLGYDELRSAANLGVVQAAKAFDSTKSQNHISYITKKAYFLAIDELRVTCGVLRKREIEAKDRICGVYNEVQYPFLIENLHDEHGIALYVPDPSASYNMVSEETTLKDLITSLDVKEWEANLLIDFFVYGKTMKQFGQEAFLAGVPMTNKYKNKYKLSPPRVSQIMTLLLNRLRKEKKAILS